MISLGVIVFAEVFQGVAQRCFPTQNEMGKTFALDRAHPALREGIQIWAARRKSQALHTFGCQGLSEVSAELGIAVVQHIAMAVPIIGLVSTTTAVANRWYHLSVTKSDAELALYVNGVLQDHKPIGAERAAGATSATPALYLGATKDGRPTPSREVG